VRTAASLVAVLVVIVGAGCGQDSPPKRSGTPATREVPPSPPGTLRLVELSPLNHSGVSGTARVLRRGRRMSVVASVTGVEAARMHMQHIHLPAGSADGACPTPKLDKNHDGIVSLEEGAKAYGAPAVSLEPFPQPQERQYDYASSVKGPRAFPLDRGVIVVHGGTVRGKYDPLLPIACGVIDAAEVREVILDPVNDSGIAGTARIARSGDSLLAWLSVGGPIGGHEHMQHIHLRKDGRPASCPTPALDKNHDGLISLEEGVPAYGAPAVSLEPFPEPQETSFRYVQRLHIDPHLPLDRATIVVHGEDVGGTYDETIPVACGAIDPSLPRAAPAGGSGGSHYDYGG
jgi:EF hand